MSARGRAVTAGALLAAAAVAGCGSGPGPAPIEATPLSYVLTLDDMPDPGFTAVTDPHPVDAGDAPSQGAGGLVAAAAAHYFRPVPDLATANGPVDVEVSVERFVDAAHARAALTLDARAHDREPGAQAFSTGTLGDAAHADRRVTTDANGVQVVQFAVEWVEHNVVGVVLVRGRLGGTGLGDALLIAHRQDDLVAGAAHSTPSPAPSPAGTPRPTR